MFRTFRLISVLLVTSIAIITQQFDISGASKMTHQQKIFMALLVFLGLSNIIIEILDHRRQKKDKIQRVKEFENLKFQLSHPVLPLSVHSTITYKTKEEIIKYAFGDKLGKHNSFDKDINGFLYTMDNSKLAEWHNWDYDQKGHLIKYPLGAELSLFKKCNAGYSASPDLQLSNGIIFRKLPKAPFPHEIHKDTKLTSFELHSGSLYLDIISYDWAIKQNTNQILSIYDLRGAKAKFSFLINTRDDDDFITPPYFTHIELKCGERPYNIIRLNMDIIQEPVINKDESDHYVGDNPNRPDSHLCINYEFLFPDNDFENYIDQYN